jgi:Helicase conserved C-terminal domain
MLDRSFVELAADIFIVDEFYKIDDARDRERANHLNQVLYKLLKSSPQFYFLGPSIKRVPADFLRRYDCKFLVTDYGTVATEIRRVRVKENREDTATEILHALRAEPVLVYCRSPANAKKLCEALLSGGYKSGGKGLESASAWIGRQYHPTWVFARGLRHGIGLHHGRVPRALAQHVVRLFNQAELNLLICTSSLIEGVNTAARHVVIYDKKIHRRNLDYFTYNNIKGRSGRMFKHFVGIVHVFDPPPEPILLDVDFPFLSQGDDTPLEILMQMDREDLSEQSRSRMDPIVTQDVLSLQVIRENSYIDPDMQINAAKAISNDTRTWHARLAWSGEPSDSQIYAACDFLGVYLLSRAVFSSAVRSARQLAYRVVELRRARGLEAYLRAVIRGAPEETRDDAIEDALEFLRNWASFHFPRGLLGLQRIANDVFERHHLSRAEYTYFASRIENLFTDPAIVALDEYGIPIQLGQKLLPMISSNGDLDETLEKVRNLDLSRAKLDPFEVEILDHVIRSL